MLIFDLTGSKLETKCRHILKKYGIYTNFEVFLLGCMIQSFMTVGLENDSFMPRSPTNLKNYG